MSPIRREDGDFVDRMGTFVGVYLGSLDSLGGIVRGSFMGFDWGVGGVWYSEKEPKIGLGVRFFLVCRTGLSHRKALGFE